MGNERVPNIGESNDGGGSTSGDLTGVVLKATIVGRRAVAYLQNGAVLDIVRVGDRLGTRTIVRIELRGIVFDDGSRLDLSGGYRATPPPAPATPHPLTLEDVRSLLVPPVQSTASAAAGTTSAPSPGYPTPGPLPTIDGRGHAPDANPTADVQDPTPYPVPGIDR